MTTLRQLLEEAIAAWDTCPEHERQHHLGGGLALPGDWYSKLVAVREAIAGTPDDPVRGCRVMLEALDAAYARAMSDVVAQCEDEAHLAACSAGTSWSATTDVLAYERVRDWAKERAS